MKYTHAIVASFSCLLFASSIHAAIVFADDFSNDGALAGSTPDVGGSNWAGSGSFQVSGGVLDMTTGAQTNNNVNFTALGAGEVLTATINVSSLGAGSSWGGVNLFAGPNATGNEVGINSQGSSWGIDANTNGGNQTSGDSTAGTITFVYDFDSGAYTWTSPDGTVITEAGSEPLNAGETYQSIRIADANAGANFTIDSITIDISPVPEPSAALLGVFAGLGLLTQRRRK